MISLPVTRAVTPDWHCLGTLSPLPVFHSRGREGGSRGRFEVDHRCDGYLCLFV